MATIPEGEHIGHLVDDYLHELLDPAQERAVAAHCETCAACRRAFGQAQARLALLRALPPTEPAAGLADATTRHIADQERRAQRRRRWFLAAAAGSIAVATMVMLGVNLYYLNLRPTPANLIVLGQRELLANAPASLRLRLVHARTGQALAGVPVVVHLVGQAGREEELARFDTDAGGGGGPRVRLPDWPEGDYQLVVTATTPGGQEVVRQRVRVKRSWKVLLTSDRPVYQPGQTILLRALSLRRPDLVPGEGQEVVYTVADPRGNVIFKHTARASRFGISSTECPLAAEALEGNYTLTCKVGDTESRVPIEVRHYVLPRFAVKLHTDRELYLPGEKGTLSIKAEYFHGQPVSGAEVEVRAEGPVVVWKGRLSNRGEARAPFLAPTPPSGEGVVRLTATVRAEETNSRTLERPVTRRPYRIEAIPEGGALVQGVANTVYLLVTRVDGTAVRDADVEVSGDAQARVTTGADGAASFSVTPSSPAVSWGIVAKGPKGEVLVRRDFDLQCGTASGDFLVRLDRPSYRAGQSMRVTVVGGERGPVYVDLLKDGQAVRCETVTMRDGSGELALDLTAELSGTLELLAYRFHPDGSVVRKARVVYVAPPDGLQVRVEGIAKEYRPGAPAELRLFLTGPQGRATPGAVSLAVVDEAAFALSAQQSSRAELFHRLEPALLGPTRAPGPWRPELGGQTTRDRALAESLARTVSSGRALAGGAHTLAASSFREKEQQVATRKRTGLHQVRLGWVLLALAALSFVYIALWVFLPLADVLKIHALAAVVLLLLALGWFVLGSLGYSVPGVADKSKSSAAQEAPAGRAGGKSDGPDGAGGEEPRVRQYFPETLLWRPQLISDDQGRLPPVSFRLADSITTWRLSATAVSAEGRLGAAEAALKVRQDFFVEPTLPPRLMRGDELGLPVTVYNYLDRPQSVRLDLELGEGLRPLSGKDVSITVPAGQRRTVHFDLKAEKVGVGRIRITAKGERASDAVERPLVVEPDGRPIEVTHSGSLDAPAKHTLTVPDHAIEGSVQALVKLYPSTFSQVVEGLDSLLRLPTGCFEQTSSACYPNVLVLEYLNRSGRASPETEAKARRYVQLGYQRLLGFEVSGGGFDWYGRPPAHRVLTAYGLMQFEDMAGIHEVDSNLLSRTRAWLLRQRERDGSWSPDDRLAGGATGEARRLATTAYIAWAVFSGSQAGDQAGATRDYLLERMAEVQDAYLLALCCNALLAMGEANVERYVEQLARLARPEKGDRVSWRLAARERTLFYGGGTAGDVETTALAVLALAQSGKQAAKARAALGWLVEQKAADGTWHSTQATILALKALLAATGKPLGAEGKRELAVRVGTHRESRVIAPSQAEVLQSLNVSPHVRRGQTPVELADQSRGGSGYQVVLRYHVPEDKAPPAREALTVDLTYDRTSLRAGETVTVKATVSEPAGAVVPMVLLELPLPPGFALEGDDLARQVREGGIGRFQVLGTRIQIYLRQLPRGKPVEVSYSLRATLPVKAVGRAARAYEYYDPQKSGTSLPVALEVRAGK